MSHSDEPQIKRVKFTNKTMNHELPDNDNNKIYNQNTPPLRNNVSGLVDEHSAIDFLPPNGFKKPAKQREEYIELDSDSDVEFNLGETGTSSDLMQLKDQQRKLELLLKEAEDKLALEIEKQKAKNEEISDQSTTNEGSTSIEPNKTPVAATITESNATTTDESTIGLGINSVIEEDPPLPVDDKSTATLETDITSEGTSAIESNSATTTEDQEGQTAINFLHSSNEGDHEEETDMKFSMTSTRGVKRPYKAVKNRFKIIVMPPKSSVRERYQLCIDNYVVPDLTLDSDVNKWLNNFHLAVSLMGYPLFVKDVIKRINDNDNFESLENQEAEYLIKLLIRRSILVEELNSQSCLLAAKEQLANVINFVTTAEGNELNSSLYLWKFEGHMNGVIRPLSALMERYISFLKVDDFYILTKTEGFYEWYLMTKYILEQMGLDGLLEPIIQLKDNQVPLQPLLNAEAEYLLRSYCLKTVNIMKLDSDWCAEKMIYKVFSECGFTEPKGRIASRISCLMIRNDDFHQLRVDYHYYQMQASVHGLLFEPSKVFDIILKRSAPKYRNYGETYLKNHPNLSIDGFIDYLESVNDLAVDLGAQIEDVRVMKRQRKSKRGGRVQKLQINTNPRRQAQKINDDMYPKSL